MGQEDKENEVKNSEWRLGEYIAFYNSPYNLLVRSKVSNTDLFQKELLGYNWNQYSVQPQIPF